jgi:hypothetical protein
MSFFSSLFGGRRSPKKNNDRHLSIVLLLRTHRFRTQDEIQHANLAAALEMDSAANSERFFTVQNGDVTLVKSGSLVLNVLQANQPYTPPALEEILKRADEAARYAWREHRAWLAVDLLNTSEVSDVEGLEWLLRLSKQLLDSECTAIFIPQMLRTMPNNGVAAFGIDLLLRKILPEAIKESPSPDRSVS